MPNLQSALLCELTAIYERQDDGWIVASVAELPGANTQGQTLDEARANLAEAVQLLLASYREQRLAEAAPTARFERIRVEIPGMS